MKMKLAREPRLAWEAIAAVLLLVLAIVLGAGVGSLTAAGAEPKGDRTRVVSIGGAVTEILYALGLEEHIVAVDTTSLYPPQALAEHPNVGYMRALSPEGILALGSSLILLEEDAGPPEALTVLERASVPLIKIPNHPSVEGLAAKIRAVGAAMGAEEPADRLAQTVVDDLKRVEGAVAKVDEQTSVLFVLSLSGGRILAAGSNTAANSIVEMAGGRNALAGADGYKPASPEAIIEAAPEVILTMDRAGDTSTAKAVAEHPVLARTPAVRNGHVLTMDGLYLLGFGPRTAQAVHDLAHALYPKLEIPTLKRRPWAEDAPPIKAGP
jgi:iron complex transport system substrate-binding protein